MKHTIKFTLLAALPVMLLFSSCATICLSKKYEVVMFGAPKDLKVTENGTEIPLESVAAASKSKGLAGYGQTITTYFTSGIKLDRRVSHTLLLKSGDKTATLNLRSKVSAGTVLINLFTTGPIGIAIDAATKKWRKLKPRNVDVEAVFNGTKWRGKRKLQRDLRRKIDHGR